MRLVGVVACNTTVIVTTNGPNLFLFRRSSHGAEGKRKRKERK